MRAMRYAERAVGQPVIRVFECEHTGSSAPHHRSLQGSFDGFGAAVGEDGDIEALRHERGNALEQTHLDFGWINVTKRMRETRRLLGNCTSDRFIAVTGIGNAEAG